MKVVDKASGYIFGEGDDATMAMMSSAMGAEFDFFKYPSFQLYDVCSYCSNICLSRCEDFLNGLYRTSSIKERYLDSNDQ